MPAVQSNIDWAGSLRLTMRAVIVEPGTWAASDEVIGVTSANVKRDADGALVESGSLTIEGQVLDTGTWVRIEVLADDGSAYERHAVATFQLVQKGATFKRGMRTTSYDCTSVLAPADAQEVEPGYYVRRGTDGASVAAELIASCTPAPVYADGAFALGEHVVFSDKTSKLKAAQELVDKAGWCIRVECDGSVHISPLPQEPAFTLGSENSGLLGTSVSIEDAKRTYTRAWLPGVTTYDVVRGALAEAELVGDMRITSQSLSFNSGITVTEECEVIS